MYICIYVEISKHVDTCQYFKTSIYHDTSRHVDFRYLVLKLWETKYNKNRVVSSCECQAIWLLFDL